MVQSPDQPQEHGNKESSPDKARTLRKVLGFMHSINLPEEQAHRTSAAETNASYYDPSEQEPWVEPSDPRRLNT